MPNSDDDDSCVFEPAIIKLTPYDRRREELRVLQEKRDQLSTHSERRLAGLNYQIEKAQERLDEEKRRDADDKWRRLRRIDDWRSGAGRELRNASRRKVRDKPNEDLSQLTLEQKEERKRDQRADANYMKRQEAKGVPASDIEAALMNRKQQRDNDRGLMDATELRLEQNPAFGILANILRIARSNI